MILMIILYMNWSGKVWKPKEEEKVNSSGDPVETEWDEVLQQATEEELVDLAGKVW